MPLTGTILELIASIVLLVAVFLLARKRLQKERVAAAASEKLVLEAKFAAQRVHLPEEARVELGYLHVTKLVSFMGTTISTKWKSDGIVLEGASIALADLCRSSPIVVKTRDRVHVIVPAALIKTGSYAGAMLACFDTKRLHARGFIYASYDSNYARGYVEVSRGTMKVLLQYTHAPVEAGKLHLALLLCARKPTKACHQLAELSEAGVVEQKLTYPLAQEVLVVHKAGVESLLKLVNTMPPLLSKELELRLVARKGLISRVLASAPLEYLVF